MSGFSTCIQQSAPDGYFHNGDCWQFNNIVCELNGNAVFSKPPEGEFLLWLPFRSNDIVHFQKVLSTLPTTQMIIQTTINRYMAIGSWCLLWDWIDYCRLGNCSQPMDKQSPSPSTVFTFLHMIVGMVLVSTGLILMMAPPSSATVASPSPAPSPAPAPLMSPLTQVLCSLQVGSWQQFAALYVYLFPQRQNWLLVS